MSKTNTKATINANIKQNGVQEITGQILNAVLNVMVDDYGTQDDMTAVQTAIPTLATKTDVSTALATQDAKLTELGYDLNRIDDYTLADYATRNGVITSLSVWGGVSTTNYKHILIPVREGDVINVVAGTISQYFAFLFSDEAPVDGLTPQMVGSLRAIPKNQTMRFVVPSGARFMELSVLDNGNKGVMPLSLAVNGFDLVTSLKSKLDGIADQIGMKAEFLVVEAVNNVVTQSLATMVLRDGCILSSGKWSSTTDQSYKYVLVKVKGGDEIKMVANTITYYYMFLSSFELPKDGDTPISVGGLQALPRNTTQTKTIPDGANYVLVQIMNNGAVCAPLHFYLNGFDLCESIASAIQGLKDYVGFVDRYTFVVDVNGSGDFTSLRDCFSHIGSIVGMASSARPQGQTEWCDTEDEIDKSFDVKIMPGTYDVRGYYTDAEWADTNTIGLIAPRNVNLIGMGKNRGDVIITCTSETADFKKSTLNIQNNFTCKNMTIVGNGTRYAVHDDYSWILFAQKHKDIRIFEDVDFIGNNNVYQMVYGAGTKGGADWLFKNCNIINQTHDQCWSAHNRDGNDSGLPEHICLEMCHFIGLNGSRAITFNPLTGTSAMDIAVVGCKFAGIHIKAATNTTSVFNIRGYGNTRDYVLTYTNQEKAILSKPQFSDEA